MTKMTLSQFDKYLKTLSYSSILFSTENIIGVPDISIKIRAEFDIMSVYTNPDSILIGGNGNSIRISHITSINVLIDNPIGVVAQINCVSAHGNVIYGIIIR